MTRIVQLSHAMTRIAVKWSNHAIMLIAVLQCLTAVAVWPSKCQRRKAKEARKRWRQRQVDIDRIVAPRKGKFICRAMAVIALRMTELWTTQSQEWSRQSQRIAAHQIWFLTWQTNAKRSKSTTLRCLRQLRMRKEGSYCEETSVSILKWATKRQRIRRSCAALKLRQWSKAQRVSWMLGIDWPRRLPN